MSARALSLVVLLSARQLQAARTAGEAAHYSFSYQDCSTLSQFSEGISGAATRALRKGPGGACQPEHLGAVLNLSLATTSTYAPVTSEVGAATPANFSGDLTDGFTLELWVKPVVMSDANDRVLAALSASTPNEVTTGNLRDNCGRSDSSPPDKVSLLLMMRVPDGCLYLRVKLSDGSCRSLPAADPNDCANNRYSLSPSSPGLNLTAPKLQHVVVSFSSYLGETRTGPQESLHAFAIYVDNELKTAGDPDGVSGMNAGGVFPFYALGEITETSGRNFVPAGLWPADHVLRVGFDATNDATSQWQGEAFMLALYGRPLTAAEVQANYEASLDNTAPVARDLSVTIAEDLCTQLPAFEPHFSDWDNGGRAALAGTSVTPQTHTFAIDPSSLARGTLYEAAGCAAESRVDGSLGSKAVGSGALWFEPAKDEFGAYAGASPYYATFAWSVTDSAAPPGTDSGVVSLNVTAVNDAPVAGDSALEVYMALQKRIYVNGSDVDGEGGADQHDACGSSATAAPTSTAAEDATGCGKIRFGKIRLLTDPDCDCEASSSCTGLCHGSLYAVGSDGSRGELLQQGDVMGTAAGWAACTPASSPCANPSVYYVSNAIDSAGERVVATDSFEFTLTDSAGVESDAAAPGRVALTILSGVDSFSSSLTVNEEEPTVVRPRGINVRGGATWFVLESLPAHGTLYQYDAANSAGGFRGQNISSASLPANVTDAPWEEADPQCCSSAGGVATCDGDSGGGHVYLCPRLVYEGDVDWFSYPTHTRDGVALGEADEAVRFRVHSPTEASANGTLGVRVRNVNDRPSISMPGNVTFSPLVNQKIFGVISVADADRDVGLYQVTLGLSGTSGSLSETTLKQSVTCNAGETCPSFDQWQWAIDDVTDLIGYCPPVCSTIGSSCQTTGCLKGDGLGDREWKFMATPATLRLVVAQVIFFSESESALTLTVEVVDFDDGVCGASASGACDSAFSVEAELDLLNSDGSGSGGSSGALASSGAVSYLAYAVALFLVATAILTGCRREVGRTARRDVRGKRRPHLLRTREQRVVLPALAVLGLSLQVLLFMARSGFSKPYTLYRMDFQGDGMCGDDVEAAHDDGHSYECDADGNDCAPGVEGGYGVNGPCVAGVPQGWMPSRQLGDVLMMSVLLPLLTLEAVGRPFGRLVVIAISALWFLYGVIRLGTFTAFDEPIIEPPWITYDGDSDEAVIGQGDVIRPPQNKMAGAILAFMVVWPLFVGGTAVVAIGLKRVRRIRNDGDESESSSDSEEDSQKRKKRKKGGKGKGKHRGRSDDKKKQRKRRDDDDDDDGSDSDSDGDRGKRKGKKPPPPSRPNKPPPPSRKNPHKPPPPAKPPPPSKPVAPTLTYHEDVAVAVDFEKEWFYMDATNEQIGPMSPSGLKTLYDDGEIHSSTYVWTESMVSWMPLSEAPIRV